MKLAMAILMAAMIGCAGKTKSTAEENGPLGPYAQIAISLRDASGGVGAVRAFYEKLGFKVIEEGGPPVPFVVLSDGMIHLRLDECEFATPRIDYFNEAAPKQVERLDKLGIQTSTEAACARKKNVTNIIDPNNQQLAIIEAEHAPVAEPRKSICLLGTFGELSVHTNNLAESIAWYRRLGFEAKKFEKPHPWAILSDGSMIIGLHQSNEFTRTTLTYFSKDSAERIEKLKAIGFKFSNEQKNPAGKVANAMLTAPDGQTFFVFEE
jgi:catechol 2,3-dioxygenase-like lactoylglutathione lyase family enzyme